MIDTGSLNGLKICNQDISVFVLLLGQRSKNCVSERKRKIRGTIIQNTHNT